MALPTKAVQLYENAFELLKQWGWGSYLDLRSGWKTRTNGHKTPLVPDSIMIHHTGGAATSTEYLLNPADRPQLKILANVHIDQNDRRIRLLAAGPASHAGNGTKANYDRMLRGDAPLVGDMKPKAPDSPTFSANRPSVGVEVDGAGGAKEWTDWTHSAVLAVSLAFNLAGEWAKDGKSPRLWTHKEFTVRKPGDPFIDAGVLRARVKGLISDGGVVTPTGAKVTEPPVLGKRVLSKDGTDSGADVVELIDLLNARGYRLKQDGMFGPSVEAAVRDYQAKMGLTVDGKVGPLTASALKGESVPQPQPEPEEPAVEVPNPEPPVPTPEPSDPPVVSEPPVDPPKPPEPTPEPVPTPKKRDFRLLQVNTLNKERFPSRYGVANNSKAWPDWMAEQKPSVMLLCETNETRRDTIKADPRFKAWKSWATGMVCVFWDSRLWTHVRTDTFDYGNGIHGAAVVTLRDNATGLEADFVSLHLPPNAAFPAAWSDDRKAQGKRDALDQWLNELLRPGVPTWVGGDFNTSTHALVLAKRGFDPATAAIDTIPYAKGDQKSDRVWFRSGKATKARVRGRSVANPGKLSDHTGWLVNGTIEASAGDTR